MKVNGVNTSNVIKLYGDHKKKIDNKVSEVKKDSLEISSLGKSLSAYSIDGKTINSEDKIESLRSAVAQGTYKPDATLTARKMIDIIKGRDV